jgi:hypothetical protein
MLFNSNKLKYLLCISLFAFYSASINAQEFHPVVNIGYDFGGDTLLSYTSTNINNPNVKHDGKIKAGNGLTLAIGAYLPVIEYVGLQATVGLKIDSEDFANGYVAFSRTPIDLLLIGHLSEHHSLSAGITYHTNTSFTLESTTVNGTDNFDNALGAIAEYTYAVRDSRDGGLKVGIRYTKITYTPTGSNINLDGSSFGLIFYAY